MCTRIRNETARNVDGEEGKEKNDLSATLIRQDLLKSLRNDYRRDGRAVHHASCISGKTRKLPCSFSAIRPRLRSAAVIDHYR